MERHAREGETAANDLEPLGLLALVNFGCRNQLGRTQEIGGKTDNSGATKMAESYYHSTGDFFSLVGDMAIEQD